jgi:hypothetical protein
MTKIFKVPYLCYHHGNAVYSGVIFYKILSIIKLQFFDGDTYFTRIAWDSLPKKLKFVPKGTNKRKLKLKP